MKQTAIRYVGEVDLNEKLGNILDEYKNGGYKQILFHVYSGVLDEALVVGVCRRLNEVFGTDMIVGSIHIAIRLKIQTKSSHKIHRSELLRLDFVNLNSWIAIEKSEFDIGR